MTTPIHSILLVFCASFVGSFGAVFLKLGAGRLHRDWRTLLTNWRLGAGVAMYLLSFVFYYLGLKQGELSVLYPMVSLGYLWTMVWSKMFFQEEISRRKIGGVALILVGVILLNVSNAR